MKKKEAESESKGSGWGIFALIFGIIALILSGVPFVGLFLGIVSLILSIIGIRKQSGKGMAIAGLVLSIIALIIAIIVSLLTVTIIHIFAGANMTVSPVNVSEYKIGDKVTINKQDNVSYVVKSAEKASSIKSIQGDTIRPEGIFVLVKIEIENVGKEATNALNSELSLMDKENRTFEPDANTQALMSNTLGAGGIRLQPGMPVTITEVYDIPATASGLKLEIIRFGFLFSKEPQARVKLGI